MRDHLTTARLAAGLFRARVRGRRRPRIVSWAITHRCNLDCRYCDVPHRPLPELDEAQAADMVDQMAAAGTRAVSFNGGEPLLRDDIEALVERCRDHGMLVSMSTNGALLGVRAGVLPHLRTLQLSVDGGGRVHESLRGAGTWRQVIAALEMAASAATPVVLSGVLTSRNLDQVDALIELARSWDARVNFLPVGRVHAHRRDIDELVPSAEAMRATFAHVERRAAEGAPILGSRAGFDYLARWPDPPRIPCVAGTAMAKLSADGLLFPCAMLEHRTRGQDAVRLGFTQAFERLADDPLRCEGCWCTKTMQLNRRLWHPVGGRPYRS
jgi:MoaA/NifB/PqqE/SkfB family radical SAM enzyme